MSKKLGQFRTQLKINLIRKPKFLFRIGSYFLRRYFKLGKPSLRSMDIMINTECTCNCKHCFATSFAPSKNQSKSKLNIKELTSALHEAVTNGVFHFSLQGGEAFLHPQLEDIIKACEPSKSYITIVTNGTTADKKMLKKVYDLGVDKICVSIDSFYPEEHDAFRRRRFTHEMAMKTVSLAREVGLNVAIGTVVTNDTLHTDSIQKLFDFVIANNINMEIFIPQLIGNWDGRTDLLLNEKNIQYLENLHKKHINIRRDLYYHLGQSGCPAVKETLYLNVYGDIFPCVFMQISIGNIRDYALKDIREKAMALREFSEYNRKCLAGENRNFIKKYISKGFGVPKPADGGKIFKIKSPKKRDLPLS